MFGIALQTTKDCLHRWQKACYVNTYVPLVVRYTTFCF